MGTVPEYEGIRLRSSTAAKERRLAALLAERGLSEADAAILGVVEDAQLLGSLDLSGFRFSWEEVRAARVSGGGPGPIVPEATANGHSRRGPEREAPG